jgi:hypothetical protein
MMAADYGHFFARGNRVGLHYSHFGHFSRKPVLILNDFRDEKIKNAPESAKSG